MPSGDDVELPCSTPDLIPQNMKAEEHAECKFQGQQRPLDRWSLELRLNRRKRLGVGLIFNRLSGRRIELSAIVNEETLPLATNL